MFFAHGQLYVVLSRVLCKLNLFMLAPEGETLTRYIQKYLIRKANWNLKYLKFKSNMKVKKKVN